jgi:protein involved in sex pheromone biosynthesis
MKIQNFTNDKGNNTKNQFIIFDDNGNKFFQNYNSIIVKISFENGKRQVFLDAEKWDYSKTTGKYRSQFLRETKKETEQKIKTGEYILTNLN